VNEASGGDLYVELADYPVDLEVVRLLPARQARRWQAVPLARDGEKIVVALANPGDLLVVDDLRAALQSRIRVLATTPESLNWALDHWHDSGAEAETLVRLAEADQVDEAVDALAAVTDASDAPIVRLVDLMLVDAVRAGASDIHLEPTRGDLVVRHRIDGVLREARKVPRSVAPALMSRVKLLAGVNIAERRLPQDGRIRTKIEGHSLDLRVAVLPSVHGENTTIRILDSRRAVVPLQDVGFSAEMMPRYEALIRRPHGAVLVTGPTGSGKSTTLYASLTNINDPGKKILTVEDPVEYEMPGVAQTQVNNQTGMTFARALRAMLRSDPDIVLVGEIRDRETAITALEAALTGHLVLSTLHTNDAASTPLRLTELGVEPYLVASALEGVVAQRLVRQLCIECRLPAGDMDGSTIYKAVGCPKCSETGYRGRQGVQELMVVTSRIEKLIAEGAAPEALAEAATEEGMVTLREAGMEAVRKGVTTPEEIMRVTA
jgi:type IV pilus assembly protein PilB